MACSSRTRVATTTVFVSLVALSACGHFGIDLLPIEDVGDGGGSGDGGGDDDASISGDGASDASSDARDAGPPVPCVGTMCSGVYVSLDVGNDNNPGTADAPVKTLPKGVAIAVQRGKPTEVYVAGKANGGMKYGDPLTIADGVSLYGGYDCSTAPCAWTRNIETFVTYLAGTSYKGIVVPDTVTRATTIDGFSIFGKGNTPDVAPGAVALTIEGAPVISHCRIEGNQLSGGTQGNIRSIGVAILGPATKQPEGPKLVENEINSSQAGEQSIAIFISVRVGSGVGVTTSAEIKNNRIRAGSAPGSYGIFSRRTSGTTVVEHNEITSGLATGGGEQQSWAMDVSGTIDIFRNSINMAAGSTNTTGPGCATDAPCGGIRSDNATATIRSNIIRGVRSPFAVAVQLNVPEGAANPVILNANTLDPVGNGSDAGSISSAIVLENGTNIDATVGKVRNNILLSGTNAKRYGVYERKISKQVHLQALDNNDFFHQGTVDPQSDFAFHYYNGSIETDYPFLELDQVTPAGDDNKNLNPDFDGTKPFHLKTTSLLIDLGTATEAPAHDVDGEGRPKGAKIDIGADEVK